MVSRQTRKTGRAELEAIRSRVGRWFHPRSVEHPWFVRGGRTPAAPLLLLALVGLPFEQLIPSSGVSTAPAAAPTPEQTYLRVAQAHGVTGSTPDAVSTARNACADLNAGGNVTHVAHYAAVRHNLDDADARIVLRAAVHTYCPAHEIEVI